MESLPAEQLIFARKLERMLEVTEGELERITEEIAQRVRGNELAPYVLSVPGVGMGTAAAFLAYVGDGSRFSKPAEVAHYVGLTPCMDCSGETNRYGHITRMGCRAIRGVILNAAWSLTLSKNGGRLQGSIMN
jgi:transposase